MDAETKYRLLFCCLAVPASICFFARLFHQTFFPKVKQRPCLCLQRQRSPLQRMMTRMQQSAYLVISTYARKTGEVLRVANFLFFILLKYSVWIKLKVLETRLPQSEGAQRFFIVFFRQRERELNMRLEKDAGFFGLAKLLLRQASSILIGR